MLVFSFIYLICLSFCTCEGNWHKEMKEKRRKAHSLAMTRKTSMLAYLVTQVS